MHTGAERVQGLNGRSLRTVIVDDSSTNLSLLTSIVRNLGGTPVAFSCPVEALAQMRGAPADMLIVDYNMPKMTGIELIERLRTISDYAETPMVMITASDDAAVRYRALEAGATDFLRRPIDLAEVKARLRNLMKLCEAQARLQDRMAWLDGEVQRATRVLAQREEEIILRLSKAAESRDNDTGEHILRMAGYCRIIAEGLGLPEAQARTLFLAAPMHDIGKIAVSDQILLKPGKLTDEERSIMELHTLHGFQILAGSDSDLIRTAADIAATHHERWDGTGYPARLKGTDIPLCGRIAAVADVFDALTSDRPYKHAWPVGDALAYIKACSGRHFDPDCVAAFAARWTDVLEVYRTQNSAVAARMRPVLPAYQTPSSAFAQAPAVFHLPV